jgi:hypothetical protein
MAASRGRRTTRSPIFRIAPDWSPGAAGLTLHTLVSDPDDPSKFWLAISAAGVFATEDGGKSWERRNRLSNAEACGHHDHPAAPRDGETGHCVHNMVRARTTHPGPRRSISRTTTARGAAAMAGAPGTISAGPALDLRLSHRRSPP